MLITTGTMAMLLGNVGLQIFNNWSNSRQNEKLQQKREEFERAAREHQTERMWQALREGQAVTIELEQARHQQRIEELESEVEQLLMNLAYGQIISNWPLSVLPIVMKNQAIGNLIVHQNESFALHCILTPSNCHSFNLHVFPYIESALGNYCNQYWSANSSHPILFYSGAWKKKDAPTQPQISSMKVALSNLPTLLISPFFRPGDHKLIFQVRMWGLGVTCNNEDIQNVWEIEPTGFQHEYTTESDYDKVEHLLDDAINDIVPYLQCLIGCMADTYFWSAHGIMPILPTFLISNRASERLISESGHYYAELLSKSEDDNISFPFYVQKQINLILGNVVIQDKKKVVRQVDSVILSYCNQVSPLKYDKLEDVVKHFGEHKEQIPLSPLVMEFYKSANKLIIKYLSNAARKLFKFAMVLSKEEDELFNLDKCEVEDILSFAEVRKDNAINVDSFVFIRWNEDLYIATFCNKQKPCVYLKDNTMRFFVFRGNKCTNECSWDGFFYRYNLQNKKIIKMEKKNFEEKIGQRFEKIGRGIGKMFDAVVDSQAVGNDSIWDNSTRETEEKDGVQQIVSFFIANAGKSITAQRIENMTVQTILDWVDNNVKPFADKVYIIKGFNPGPKKHVFCVFFGGGDSIFIKDEDPRMCFITDQFNDEMKETFNNNNICIIPLK